MLKFILKSALFTFLIKKFKKEILKYIKIYIDVNKMYKQALSKKIDMFYQAMSWDKPVDKRYTLEKFF